MLELAAGSGRVSLPLAAAGIGIVALDSDAVMLGRCNGEGGPLAVVADMRRFALARRFAMVFVAYNSLQLLTSDQDMAACLTCARRHLAPSGFVGLEVTDFQAGAADGAVDEELLGEAEGVRLIGTLVHDMDRRTSRYCRRFAGPGWSIEDEIELRSLDRGELEALLAAAGLVATTWWVNGATLRAVAVPQENFSDAG